MELAEIQHAIEQLPKHQQARLAAWLAERDQAEWEAEIEHDFAPGGAGMALLEEMKAEARSGKFRPFYADKQYELLGLDRLPRNLQQAAGQREVSQLPLSLSLPPTSIQQKLLPGASSPRRDQAG